MKTFFGLQTYVAEHCSIMDSVVFALILVDVAPCEYVFMSRTASLQIVAERLGVLGQISKSFAYRITLLDFFTIIHNPMIVLLWP